MILRSSRESTLLASMHKSFQIGLSSFSYICFTYENPDKVIQLTVQETAGKYSQ